MLCYIGCIQKGFNDFSSKEAMELNGWTISTDVSSHLDDTVFSDECGISNTKNTTFYQL